MLLSREAVRAFMSRDLDDFRWMKQLTREQIERELASLRVRPRFKGDPPWLHQLVCFLIGLSQPRFQFLLDMGAGKTRIISMLIEHFKREGKLDRALITVPRIINIESWMEDVPLRTDLEPWAVNVSDIEEKRERLLRPRGDVTIIDMQSLQWALCKKEKHRGKHRLVRDDKVVRQVLRLYNLLGIDETHKQVANHNNLWFSLLDQLSKGMDYAYGATGTLFGKRVEDAWSQFYVIDRGETLGENLGPFRAAFFDAKMSPWKGQVFTFNKTRWEEFHRTLQHRSIRYEEDELLELPARVPRRKNFSMSEEQREHYNRALEGLIQAGGNLRELDAQYTRMRQIVSGYLVWKDDYGEHVLHFKQNPKLDGLEALIDEMGDSKIIVVYWYTETGRMIVDRVKEMGIGVEWLWGGTKDRAALRERFMNVSSNSRVLVMQAEAGGTGNDGLQKVARYMVFYETPTDPTTRRQTEKRIHRPGQTKRSFIYDLVMMRSLDAGILSDIKEGVDTHNDVVNGKGRRRGFYLGDISA